MLAQTDAAAFVQGVINLRPEHLLFRVGQLAALSAQDIADVAAFLRVRALNEVATPQFALTPTGQTVAEVNFGTVPDGGTAPQAVYFRNAGTAPMTIGAAAGSIEVLGAQAAQFTTTAAAPAGSTQCALGMTLAPDQNCGLTVTFSPSLVVAAGTAQTATLRIRTANGSVVSDLSLTGTRMAQMAPTMTLSPSPPGNVVNLGTVQAGNVSPASTITVFNNGSLALQWGSIGLGGANAAEFQVGGTCVVGTPVGQGAGSCLLSITFRPPAGAANGPRTATLTLQSNAPNSPLVLTLNGAVGSGTPMIGLSSTSNATEPLLRLQSTAVGTLVAGSVYLRNIGEVPMTITGITLTSGSPTFSITPAFGCIGSPIPIGGQCNVAVTYTAPNVPAVQHTGTLSVATTATTSAGASGPHVVNLQGVVIIDPSTMTTASVNTGSVNFRGYPVGQPSTPQRITVTNTGGRPLTVSSVATSAPAATSNFAIGSNTCNFGAAPGASCTIDVTFRPRTTGLIAETMTITYNGGAMGITLSGVGQSVEPSIAAAGGGALPLGWLLLLALATLAAASRRRGLR